MPLCRTYICDGIFYNGDEGKTKNSTKYSRQAAQLHFLLIPFP